MTIDKKPSDRMRELRAEMEAALSLMTAHAANWLEVFNAEPAAAARYDELHAHALRDYRRAERKLLKIRSSTFFPLDYQLPEETP